MRSVLVVSTILFSFIAYTAFKIYQIWPSLSWLSWLGAALVFALMLSATFAYRRNLGIFETSWFQFLTWAGSFLMAFWATFIMISLPFDVVRLLAQIGFGYSTAEKIHESFTHLNIYFLAVSAILVMVGFLQVLLGPAVKRVSLPIKNLHPALEGFKILQVSDLHVGPTIRTRYVRRVVEKINREKPDVVVFTGDIVDADADSVKNHLTPLRSIQSPHGSYYTTGNHEYYWGVETIVRYLQEVGLSAVLNSNKILKVSDARVMIAGVTDPMGKQFGGVHQPNIEKSVAHSEKVDFKVLLAHRPDAAEASKAGFNLQLSGHTHAGQFFPFSLLIGLAHKYTRGLYKHESMWVYVNPGTGYWGPANRFAVQSEISVMILKTEDVTS